MKKLSNQKTEEQIVELLNSIKIPFAGTTISSKTKQYHLSHFKQITISGVGPVFYLNKKNQKIYTVLQRRYKDNFHWLFPGGYVEVPPENCKEFIAENGKKVKIPSFESIKATTMKSIYSSMIDEGCWQKVKKKINDPKGLEEIFKKKKIKWPKELDANWQSAWQREILEETGVDLDKFPKKIIIDFPVNKTLMIGAEPDRLTNIDGTFTAFLGELEKAPKTRSDAETEEVKWVAIDEIKFDKKKNNYIAGKFIVNSYTISLIEEALYRIICYQIKQMSKITNPITKEKISRFDTTQNLQSFLLEKSQNFKIEKLTFIKEFLSWKFGELEIAKNLCGKNGSRFYKLNFLTCKFLIKNKLKSFEDFTKLNNLLKNG